MKTIKHIQETTITLILIAVTGWIVVVGMAAAWPRPLEQNVIYYNGWQVHSPNENSTAPIWTALRDGCAPITENNFSDVVARIDYEASK